MPTRLKEGLENGGDVTQSELQEGRRLGCWTGDAGRGSAGRWKRKAGGELVVRLWFCDVDSRPSSSTMMTV